MKHLTRNKTRNKCHNEAPDPKQWPLRKLLSDYSVTSVQREGLGGTENGELLAALDGRFDVFILCDKNLRYQQKEPQGEKNRDN
jgi:hypothetical protein